MSAITPAHGLDVPAATHAHPPGGDNYLTHSRGVMSWLFSLDHKRIGLMYLAGVLTAFFIGGMFAMLLPNRSPAARSGAPMRTAEMSVVSSGSDVATARKIEPTHSPPSRVRQEMAPAEDSDTWTVIGLFLSR